MPEVYSLQRRVQFAETDMAGVLHFSNYYRWMEEVEHAFWRSLDSSVIVSNNDGVISWPRVKTQCEYFAPARFEDVIDLLFTVAKIGDRSVTYKIEFRHDVRRIAVGLTTAVCCMMREGTFSPILIPDDLREKLASFAPAAGD